MTIEYFENELLPGKPMFRCAKLSASLQVTACADMWRDANANPNAPERLHRCMQCPIGAKHAGVADANMSTLRGTTICSRCHRTDLRLIGGNVCVSCKNRSYEWIKGKNAKGKAPVKCAPLQRRTVRFVCEGRAKAISREYTTATDELVVELLRDQTKRVLLGRGKPGAGLRQGALL